MAAKINKCTLGTKHKWKFVRNVIHTFLGPQTGRVTKVGRYRCECGATKNGPCA
jgi:hypothetical protein